MVFYQSFIADVFNLDSPMLLFWAPKTQGSSTEPKDHQYETAIDLRILIANRIDNRFQDCWSDRINHGHLSRLQRPEKQSLFPTSVVDFLQLFPSFLDGNSQER